MTFKHAIGSLRVYGLKGLLEFLKRTAHHRSEVQKWKCFVISDKHFKPSQGITIIGNLAGPNSLSKVLRDFCINLKRAGIPYQAYNTGCPNPIPASEYEHLLTPIKDFKLNRFSTIIGMAGLPPLPKTDCKQYSIYFWEFESGLLGTYPELADPCTIIVNSNFNLATFKNQLPPTANVFKILYPFQFTGTTTSIPEKIRAKYGIATSDFMVFYNFDYCSGYHRKNPEGAVAAFATAFRNIPSAKLVFKTQNSAGRPKYAAKLKQSIRDAAIEDKVIFINNFIPQDDLVGLTNACDAYLSLHRGEGFGLGIAESMILGKPVVVTNYSGPTEFCNPDNSMLVPFRMTKMKANECDVWQDKLVDTWAEPDVNAAAEALKKLYDNPTFARQLGDRARQFIIQYFSIENFKASVMAFLSATQTNAPA